jgi:cytochrome c peroxidase
LRDLPLFKVTCASGRVIHTQDPGRGLITGKCADVGAIVPQQLRGLAARPPYFANGTAATLREVVDFYDRRYSIGYTEREKQDLVNFLKSM